jgi:diguanylate cyclase (GGDEF)-like protein
MFMAAGATTLENDRLADLDQYDILDTSAEESFDRITRILSSSLDVPMAAVTLIDGHRQWLKSRQGPLGQESCRQQAFCNVTIGMHEPLIVEDALQDARFENNPAVVGPPYVRFYAGVPLRSEGGHNLGALCAIDATPRRLDARQVTLLQDLAAMVMSVIEARRLAGVDSLTGTLTRKGFRDEAERALALSSRHDHGLSCIVLDLDHFKCINDTYGHAIGDRVLSEAAKVCLERVRNTDILGRIGGEEFAIVLPHAAAADALRVAEQIRSTLEQRVILLPEESLRVSASFGIAARDGVDISLDELLRRADQALYCAKDAGRNTCAIWRGLPGPAGAGNIRRVLKAGQIVFNAGHCVIDCTVKGLSDQAARLNVVSTSGIPERFKLAIASDGFSRACKITQKLNASLDVVFV